MAAKRGDIKTQNGQRYRYGYKNGKLMWIKDQSGLNPKLGEKLKIAGKTIKKFGGNVKDKVFGTPKKIKNWKSKTGTKTPNENMKTWRVDKDKNKKLQQERESGKDETYSRELSPEATKQVTKTKTESKNKKSTKKYGNAPKGYIKSKGKFVSLKTNAGKQLAKLEERKKKLRIKRFG